jgi:hypothetical protein
LAVDLKRWKEEQERIKGEAVLNNRPHPTITPWLLEKTKIAIRQFFIDTCITPFEDGRWTQYLRELFTNHRKTSTSDKILSNVLKLQDKKCISAYLFSNGLDDQDPSQWGDAEVSHLVVPEADYPSGSEEGEGEEEEEEEEEDQRGGGGGSAANMSHLVVPDPDYPSDSEEEEGEEEEEEVTRTPAPDAIYPTQSQPFSIIWEDNTDSVVDLRRLQQHRGI